MTLIGFAGLACAGYRASRKAVAGSAGSFLQGVVNACRFSRAQAERRNGFDLFQLMGEAQHPRKSGKLQKSHPRYGRAGFRPGPDLERSLSKGAGAVPTLDSLALSLVLLSMARVSFARRRPHMQGTTG